MGDLQTLLERFRRGPELLAVVLTGAAGEEIDFASGPGKWSIRQIMAHLADSEVVGTYRLRLMIAEDAPTLTAYDQDKWAANLDYLRRKPTQSLESVRRLRTETYDLLRELPESAFERIGNHTEVGPITLRSMVERIADHVESHARQLQTVREAYQQAKGKK